MAISAITVTVDRDEYSKYEPGLDKINASIVATGAVGGETLTWTLTRLDGYGPVGTGTILATLPTTALVIDLNALIDADNINWANAGSYSLSVTSGAATGSAALLLALISVQAMRARWLFGIKLMASDVLLPVVQPVATTGVVVERASQPHSRGAFTLTWNPVGRLLSAAGGPSITIPASGVSHPVLIDSTGKEYVQVRVDAAFLPTGATSESLMLDNAELTDTQLRAYIQTATANTESYLNLAVEPRIGITALALAKQRQTKPSYYYDQILQPVEWIQPYDWSQWLNIHMPVRRLLKHYELHGYFNSTLVTDINEADWVLADEISGMLQLVPRQGAVLTWQFVHAIFLQVLMDRNQVPDFWHYSLAHGLRDLREPQFAPVLEVIAKKASLDILNEVGTAFKLGRSAESVSRDGVSQSISYTNSAVYGAFAALTTPYKEWLDDQLPRLKRRLGGVTFVTI